MGGWVCCSPTLKTWGLFLGEYVRRNGWAGQGRGGGVDWKQCWMKSQTTVAGANQCRYPTEFDLEKSTFYLEKKSHFKKKCLDFSFSLFLSSPSSEVGSSFILVFFLFFSSNFHFSFLFYISIPSRFFTRSRLRRLPLRTPDPLHQYPWGQCPRWADERSSAICIRSLSCPTVPCVSVQREGKSQQLLNYLCSLKLQTMRPTW